MIKKITVESYDGSFGMEHIHRNEKFEITKDKVSYVKNYYQEIPLVHSSVVGGYSKTKSSWSYGLNDETEISRKIAKIKKKRKIKDGKRRIY